MIGILCGMQVIYTEHKQKMAMIEKGMKPEALHPPHKPEDMLIGGLVVIGIGFAFLSDPDCTRIHFLVITS